MVKQWQILKYRELLSITLAQKIHEKCGERTHKTQDRVTGTPLKTGCELRYSERVSSSCSTSGTHRVNLVHTVI
jgi:hypothetical protein